jgi:hypothetical protein
MSRTARIPLVLKLLYTAFMAVLVPVYLYHYGPTNFLYFCDVAAVLTLLAIWLESPVLASACLVGIFLPQMLWVADFFVEFAGGHLTGLTGYMFDTNRPFYLRFLSFFHFWLPFLLVYMVWRLGYDRRGLRLWTPLALALLIVCYVFISPPPPHPSDPNRPVNINYVYGFSDTKAQEMMDQNLYFALVMLLLPLAIFVPTHLFFQRVIPRLDQRQVGEQPVSSSLVIYTPRGQE